MLQTEVLRLIEKEHRVVGVEVCNETVHRIIRCKNVIASDDYAISTSSTKEQGKVIHGIFVVEGNNKGDNATVTATPNSSGEVHDIYGNTNTTVKELRDIVVIPATNAHRAIYLLIVHSFMHFLISS